MEEGLRRFVSAWKMWLMLAQLEERLGNREAARAALSNGLKRCIDSVALWRCAAALEERSENVAKARALLEQVRGLGFRVGR